MILAKERGRHAALFPEKLRVFKQAAGISFSLYDLILAREKSEARSKEGTWRAGRQEREKEGSMDGGREIHVIQERSYRDCWTSHSRESRGRLALAK